MEMPNWDDDAEMASIPTTSTKTTAPAPQKLSDKDHNGDPLNVTYQDGTICSQQLGVADSSSQEGASAMNPLEPTSEIQDMDENKIDSPSDQHAALNDLPGPAVSTGARRRDPNYNLWGSHKKSKKARKRNQQQRNRNQQPRNRKRQRRIATSQKLGNFKRILVPTHVVGLIIGRKGQTINEIEHESTAAMLTGTSDGLDSDITIFGTDEAIALAEEKIGNLVERAERSGYSFRTDFHKTNADGVVTIDWDLLASYCKAQEHERNSGLPPTRKDFYNEDPILTTILPGDVAQWRKDNNDMVVRRNSVNAANLRPIPNPVQTFEQAFMGYPMFLEEIYQSGVISPSPIQCQALPILLRGDDFICTAQSGTGRSLAIILSAIIHVAHHPTPKPSRNHPIALFLAPNKRFVLQLQRELKKYQYEGFQSLALYKGDRNEQLKVRNGCFDLIVCTPSRFSDLVLKQDVEVINFTYIALFEADTMLENCNENLIRRSFIGLRQEKQVVLTCATWSIPVRVLALSYMKDPIQIKYGSQPDPIAKSMTHTVELVDEREKLNVLLQQLRILKTTGRVIIFCGNKTKAMEVHIFLAAEGIKNRALHNETSRSERDAMFRALANGRLSVLLATDSASRAIDMQYITHIINLDCPGQIDEYVQRINRTRRNGTILTIMSRYDWGQARDLIHVLQEAQQVVPPELEDIANKCEAMNMVEEESREQRRDGNNGAGPSSAQQPGCSGRQK